MARPEKKKRTRTSSKVNRPKRQCPINVSVDYRATAFKISVARIKKIASAILRRAGWHSADAHFVLVDDPTIRCLNRKYLGHDHATDVMAFSQLEGKGIKPFLQGRPFLGDVVISLETAQRQAKTYQNSVIGELALYLCHGILHLMGYCDKTLHGARQMEALQSKILADIGMLKNKRRGAAAKRRNARRLKPKIRKRTGN